MTTHSAVPEILTERLLLRQITHADLDDWAARIFADPVVMRYLPRRDITPRERAERGLEFLNGHWLEYGYGEWGVITRADHQMIGHAGLAYLAETGEVEVDFALAGAYWGLGMGTEAARASVRFGFEKRGLTRVIGLTNPENSAARRVLEKVGFVYEKEARYFNRDVAYYTIRPEQFRDRGDG